MTNRKINKLELLAAICRFLIKMIVEISILSPHTGHYSIQTEHVSLSTYKESSEHVMNIIKERINNYKDSLDGFKLYGWDMHSQKSKKESEMEFTYRIHA